MTQPPTNSAKDLVNQLLDNGYARDAGAVVDAITKRVSTGIISQRLSELNAEASRLASDGKKLSPDNAVLRALQADLSTVLDANVADIDRVAPTLKQAANNAAAILTRTLALGDTTDEQLATAGVRWNVPDPQAVLSLIGYSDSSAWQEELSRYTNINLQALQDIAIRGIVNGYGPLRVAEQIKDVAQSIPVYQANTLMRTLQLQSYRDATAVNQLANQDIISTVIRIATLDNRTCLACIALHGTELRVGERVNDHHNGRCTSIAVIKGRTINVQNGVDWFNSQSADRKRTIAGEANYKALSSGAVSLSDFVVATDDRVFGEMVNEASLKGILGERAKTFYSTS